jgi:hypothetical protein
MDKYERRKHGITEDPDTAISTLNYRFQEHAIGYRYESGRIIRTDSEYAHAETVKPALQLLHEQGFHGAETEFMKAHEHYRKGNLDEAFGEALKALESTMKAICDAKGWKYEKDDTANKLIAKLFDCGLVPSNLQSQFAALRSTLESGVPTLANPERHGDGTEPRSVPSYLVAYALHLTASAMIFLVEAHKESYVQ